MPTGKTILAKINYSIAKLYVIHCFDNRPLWFETWSAICITDILLARIPLAGASAKGKHYLKHFEDKKANKETPVVIATHFPCGWFDGQPELAVRTHGQKVVDYLIGTGKMKAINVHFSLNDGVLAVDFYDPLDLAKEDTYIKRVVRATKSFQGRKVDPSELEHVPTHRVVIANEVFGPPIGDGILVAHHKFVVSDTLAIAQKLNGGTPVMVETVDQVYTPNYSVKE